MTQSKCKEYVFKLTPWLFDCPSQILRNSVVNWYQTYGQFMRGECGKPKKKPFKDGSGSIHLTRELFSFETCEDGNTRLFIGSKRNNIGYLFHMAQRMSHG
jgi:putative transposase